MSIQLYEEFFEARGDLDDVVVVNVDKMPTWRIVESGPVLGVYLCPLDADEHFELGALKLVRRRRWRTQVIPDVDYEQNW